MRKRTILFLAAVFYLLTGANAQTWDERPVTDYLFEYTQDFNPTAGWDRFTFYGQWNALMPNIFNASDISTGALQFVWIEKRVICSKQKYSSPYVFEADYDYSTGSNRGGIVIRIATLSESIQEPESDPGFNREGIAFYPTSDGSSMIVQFSEEDKGYSSGMNFTRIEVPKPDGVASLFERAVLRIEDFDTNIYIFYNDEPFIRIDLNDKIDDTYTSGSVYDANMQIMGSFTDMEVEKTGHVAVAQRDAKLRLYNASLMYNQHMQVFNPEDTVIFESPYRDLYADTWVATDALGRVMPDYEVAGPLKEDKERYVGVFYITWHLEGHHTNFPSPYYADVTKILEEDPTARLDAQHPLWNYGLYSYHWGEPELGYFLSQDEYVIRKDMAMLANAGVDVLIMDVTNAVRYWDEWEVLFSTMQKMKAEGNKVPQFCFWAFNGPVITVVQDLYDYIYKTERFKDLWFYWEDKPLLLYKEKPDIIDEIHPNPNYDPDAVSNPENPNYGNPYYTEEYFTDYTQEVKDFFTTRNMWWGYYEWEGERYIGTEDNWSFGYSLEDSRVRNMNPDDLVATHNGQKEQAAVTPAQHPSSLVGKSWSRANREPELNEYDLPEPTYVPWLDQTVENPEGYGIYFQERWDEALSSDPAFIYLNDWNEWTAGKFHDGAVSTFMRRASNYYFVDQYNSEFNRGIQPMKDGYTDNYYMQMVENIRKYKGVRQHKLNTAIRNISIDNEFSDWESDTTEFRDAIGDTRHRYHNGYGGLVYRDTMGRNDIMTTKVAYDNENVYFYVNTVRDLTSFDDQNWMLLFIDSDRNSSTGWEGYDFLINKSVISSEQTTLMQWTGLTWENEYAVPCAINGNEMEIGLPLSALNLPEGMPEFYFKWVDNLQHHDDISAFFTAGESAPERRFNYNFSTSELLAVEQSPYKELNIPGTIEMEDFDNGSPGIAYADAVAGNSGGAYRTEVSVDIKENPDNGFYITDLFSKEWLEYTANIEYSGIYTVSVHYSAGEANQGASLSFNDTKVSSLTFPETGSENDWSTIETDIRIQAGIKIFKLDIDSASGNLQIDKIVFTGKELIYPDDGSGLTRTLFNGDVGGRNWFTDSICTEIDAEINHTWESEESPGCGTRDNFWNARWEGYIEAHFTEEYTISLYVNDNARLWVDEVLIIDAWGSRDASKTHIAKVNLTADEKVPVIIEYANKIGEGAIRLEWESENQLKEVIPQSQLFPKSSTYIINADNARAPFIYPNPANNQVSIKPSLPSKVTIYDLHGQVIYSGDANSDIHEVNVSSWSRGIYFIDVRSSENVYIQKLIIQ